jgi:predicted kinase
MDLVSTDVVAAELFGPNAGLPATDAGYDRVARPRSVQRELLRRLTPLVDQGISVILEDTFLRAEFCARAAALARRHGAEPLILRCHCPESVALERIEDLLRGDACLETARERFQYQREQEEPAPANVPNCNVDTSVAPPALLNAVASRLKPLTRIGFEELTSS